jgi:hypothetical protein
MMEKRCARSLDDRRIGSDNAGMDTQGAGPEGRAEGSADMAVRAWRRLAERLSPIIGERGFRVLYARSLLLAQPDFPFLLLPPPGSDAQESFFASLKQSLEGHPALAADADRALLLTFTGLLNSLIGEGLTARLVHDAPPDASAEGHSQESNNDR